MEVVLIPWLVGKPWSTLWKYNTALMHSCIMPNTVFHGNFTIPMPLNSLFPFGGYYDHLTVTFLRRSPLSEGCLYKANNIFPFICLWVLLHCCRCQPSPDVLRPDFQRSSQLVLPQSSDFIFNLLPLGFRLVYGEWCHFNWHVLALWGQPTVDCGPLIGLLCNGDAGMALIHV